MSSEQKKFAPELMGDASLLTRIRKFLSSVLDIGKYARIRLSRMTNPEYDAISDILATRDRILGHKFVESQQKRAPLRDPMMEKANKAIRDLEATPEKFEVVQPALPMVQDQTFGDATPCSDVEVKVPMAVPDPIEFTDPVEAVEEEFFPEVKSESVPMEVVDEVRDILCTVDDWAAYSGEVFDEVREDDLLRNVLSIIDHDNVIEQMVIDHPSYEPFVDEAPKFPEARPVQRQTTLDIEMEESVIEVSKPWYTDADLIRIGIRAATEDCIESIAPMMEQFDEPEVAEVVVDDVDVELIEMAVKAMTDDSIENVVARIAQASKVTKIVSDVIDVEEVSEPVSVEEDVVKTQIVEAAIVAETIAAVPVVEEVSEPVSVEEDVVKTQIVEAAIVAETIAAVPVVEEVSEPVSVEEDVVKTQTVEAAIVAETLATTPVEVGDVVAESVPVEDVPAAPIVDDRKVSVAFRFGTGMASGSSVGVKFRFGVVSQ